MAYIYKIQNLKNNKYYIGSTNSFKTRKRQHISDLNNSRHHNYKLQEDWDIHGENNFKFSVLERITKSKQYEREQDYLDLMVGKESEVYNIRSTSIGDFALTFHPIVRECKVCYRRFKTYDLVEFCCSADCEMKYDFFPEEFDSEERGWRESNYEYKNIEDWDVDDFIAAAWDDRWSK